MNSKMVLIAAAVLILLGGSIYVMSQNNDTDYTTTVTPTSTMTQTSPTSAEEMNESTSSGETSGEVKEFVVTGSNFKFDKGTLTVHEGDTVRIVFKNSVGMHDFVIDEFNAKTKVIGAGQQETIEFVALKKGSYEYYCSVGTHRQIGMKGTLVVQ